MVSQKDIELSREVRSWIELFRSKEGEQSIEKMKANTQELAVYFRELTSQMGRANDYFERMERSSTAMESLTKVLTAFTALLLLFAAHTFLMSFGMDPWVAYVGAFIIMLAALWYMKREIPHRTDKKCDKS